MTAGLPVPSPPIARARPQRHFCRRRGVVGSPTIASMAALWIPFAGEVAWEIDGKEEVYWQGRIETWESN